MKSGLKTRVGAVSYLNTKPLVQGLGKSSRIELVLDLPSRLADGLRAGQLDVALIPSIEYLRNPGYSVVSDACIACRGPVLSVKLLSHVPMRDIKSVALDEGSRTSVALARILLHERFGISPRCRPLPIGGDPTGTETDAVLLIGDRAIQPPEGEFLESWDLGDHWCRWAELPFVFAMWTARRGADTSEVGPLLEMARDAGVRHLPEIAEREAGGVGLTTAACLSYLRDNLHFHLGPREREGLRHFQLHAIRLGIVPGAADAKPTRKFHDCEAT